jgi:prepilin-type N-terminal cleavage/methylation domain-containing protein
MRRRHRCRDRDGFTLIELLVVVGIIAVLAATVMAGLNYVRANARNAKRQADVRTIQKAFALYFTTTPSFPAGTNVCLRDTDAISVILKNANAIKTVPPDPTCPATTTCCYLYNSAGGANYTLRYTKENPTQNVTVGPI